jgi:threonine aldolase
MREKMYEEYRKMIQEYEAHIADLEGGGTKILSRTEAGDWVEANDGLIASYRRTIEVLRKILPQDGDTGDSD